MLVAHELGPLAPLVDRAVVMRDGRVAYDGPPLTATRWPRRTWTCSATHHHHASPSATTTPARTPSTASPLEGTRPMSDYLDLLSLPFMQRALLAAIFTGLAAPAVGTYLVQRRLALMGDGIGHVAVTGVALGLLTGTSPTWTAVVVADRSARSLIEVIRERGHTNGDVALALLFYGGLAGGVLITGLAGRERRPAPASTCSARSPRSRSTDVMVTMVLAAVVVVVCVGLSPQLFAVAQDQEFARVAGLRIRVYNLLVAVLAAVTVTVAMRTVGLLLVSALMVVPVATAQQLTRSFRTTLAAAMVLGTLASLGGLLISAFAVELRAGLPRPDHRAARAGRVRASPGRSASGCARAAGCASRSRVVAVVAHQTTDDHPHEHGEDCGHVAVPHGDHVDYVHDGHRHAPHGRHYDEH